MTSVSKNLTIPREMDIWLKDKCLSPSRILQKSIKELMEKEKQEGKK